MAHPFHVVILSGVLLANVLTAQHVTGNTIVFNTLGPGNTYDPQGGFDVHATSVDDSPLMEPAAQFVPTASGALATVDLGLTYVSPGPALLDVFLYNDAGGIPDNSSQLSLGSVTPTAVFGANDSIVTLNVQSSILVTAGSAYWLALKPVTPNDRNDGFDRWNGSLPPVPGTVVVSSDDIHWDYLTSPVLPAFRLTVNDQIPAVPETGRTVSLLLIGLSALIAVRARRRGYGEGVI